MKTQLGDLTLRTPVLTASGTFGYGVELAGAINYDALGAIVTKTVTERPRRGNPQPRLWETDCGLLNSIGLQNPGVERFCSDYLPRLKRLGPAIIVSIAGNDEDEVRRLAARLAHEPAVDGIEINLSCPNLGGKRIPAEDVRTAARYVRAAKLASGRKPVFAKLSPNVTDICRVALACETAGADGLVLVNTVKAVAVDIARGRIIAGGYSGPGIKPIGLRAVCEVYRHVRIPIVGCGGIASGRDALEYILCGARCVAVGSAGFARPDLAGEIVFFLRSYLRGRRRSLADLVGSLHGESSHGTRRE